MIAPEVEIQVIASVVAVTCAIPGVFLVLRRMALMSDAISHSILLGIALGFLVAEDTSSPLLILAAAATGVVTVALVEVLNGTHLVKEDAAIGLVFPALFSIGVIIISRYAGDVHLDIDAVLLGELVFAPFDRLIIDGMDLGPRILWVMGTILLLNVIFIVLFYKEIKLSTFDAALAGALGFSPAVIHYLFMSLVSVTAVGAFDAVGSILVVALMIAPPASAYLLTDRLPWMIALSAGLGVLGAWSGYWLSYALDVSVAGSMATMTGVIFGITFLLAPQRGVVATARRRVRQKWEFAATMLAIHLLNHEDSPDADEESRVAHLQKHLRWDPAFAEGVVRRAERRGWVINPSNERLRLTDRGRSVARETTSA
ncbi:MAG TPA: metal ABC transporter permease [Longimicrobiaceae bacterium]|nr:metal ABC transporter permease [Longimicrobiaceae bacterium]